MRPIVVGNVFLRLIGSLGLQLNRGACDDYFMGPSVRGKQYGVGTKDGCTLMAASIEAFMESNPGSIDIAGDTMNAFNVLIGLSCDRRSWRSSPTSWRTSC